MNKIPFPTTVFWTVAKISSSRNCDNKNCLEFFGSRIATERGKIIAPSLTKSDFNLLYTFLNLLCCKTRKKSSNIFFKSNEFSDQMLWKSDVWVELHSETWKKTCFDLSYAENPHSFKFEGGAYEAQSNMFAHVHLSFHCGIFLIMSTCHQTVLSSP